MRRISKFTRILFQTYIMHQIAGNSSDPSGQWKLAKNSVKKYGTEVKCFQRQNMLCEICKQAAKERVKLTPPYARLHSAKFFRGNLTVPNTDYKNETEIDIVKCRYDIYAPNSYEVDIFHLTRGREEKSAYFLKSFYSYNEEESFGMKYILRRPYVTWD